MMITELTKEQQEQISVYVDKWMNIHLSTEQCTDEEISKSL